MPAPSSLMVPIASGDKTCLNRNNAENLPDVRRNLRAGRVGRPRIHCRFCTPRSNEDKAAAREHWARVYSERARERNARSREQMRSLKARQSRAVRERIRSVYEGAGDGEISLVDPGHESRRGCFIPGLR